MECTDPKIKLFHKPLKPSARVYQLDLQQGKGTKKARITYSRARSLASYLLRSLVGRVVKAVYDLGFIPQDDMCQISQKIHKAFETHGLPFDSNNPVEVLAWCPFVEFLKIFEEFDDEVPLVRNKKRSGIIGGSVKVSEVDGGAILKDENCGGDANRSGVRRGSAKGFEVDGDTILKDADNDILMRHEDVVDIGVRSQGDNSDLINGEEEMDNVGVQDEIPALVDVEDDDVDFEEMDYVGGIDLGVEGDEDSMNVDVTMEGASVSAAEDNIHQVSQFLKPTKWIMKSLEVTFAGANRPWLIDRCLIWMEASFDSSSKECVLYVGFKKDGEMKLLVKARKPEIHKIGFLVNNYLVIRMNRGNEYNEHKLAVGCETGRDLVKELKDFLQVFYQDKLL
ncbi:hypothetical protein HDU76_006352 [Blyttiomyces sp. JEL0837]|nr:hypothetical protein HDU76_006352 [Blyttiomyces sp. JEL0837]